MCVYVCLYLKIIWISWRLNIDFHWQVCAKELYSGDYYIIFEIYNMESSIYIRPYQMYNDLM